MAAGNVGPAKDFWPRIQFGPVLLGITCLMLVLIFGKADGWGWISPAALLVAAHSANRARLRGWKQLAGWLLSGAIGFLPVLTISSFGLAGNPLVYLATLGVMIVALTVSAKAAVSLACGIFSLLVAQVLDGNAGIDISAGVLSIMFVLLFGITVLSVAAKISIHGTIAW